MGIEMKRIRSAGLLVALLAVVGLAPAAGASGSGQWVPFKGRVSGEVEFLPAPECQPWGLATTVTEVPGVGSHLGRMTMSSRHCAPSGDEIGPGTMTFTAANGDQIFTTYTGTAPFPEPGTQFVVAQTHAIVTGGTGRFSGATGHLDVTGTVEFQGLDDMSWPGVWVWTGMINY
jgi:hypothetical protein